MKRKITRIFLSILLILCLVPSSVVLASSVDNNIIEQTEDAQKTEKAGKVQNTEEIQNVQDVENIENTENGIISESNDSTENIEVEENALEPTDNNSKEVQPIDNAVKSNEVTLNASSSGYYITQQGLTWAYKEDTIDVGVAFQTNDLHPQFKWQSYNLDTKVWETIADWNPGNWATWRANKGNYWLHCEMRTSDGSATDQITICFAYVAGNTQIAGTYLGGTDSGDGTLLFGCSSTSTAVGLTYSFKLYNVNTGSWTCISDRKGQWASYAPQTGTYWAHYELYTTDGRLADTRTYAFSATRPVRRALCIGTPASLNWAGNNLNSIGNMFANTSFLGSGGINTSIYRDQDISNITALFQNTFSSTTDNDISYVYIVCHSGSDGRICIANNMAYITTAQLRQLCDTYIKGKVVVMLDSCFSGQAISPASEAADENYEEFANNFINQFSPIVSASGELATDRYYVLCSSLNWQESWGTNYGFATTYWDLGGGWNPENNTSCSLAADSNGDGRITLSEMFNYSKTKVTQIANAYSKVQTVTVYPQNSNFVILGRY